MGAHDRFNVGVGRDFVGHIGLPAGDLLEDGGRLRIFLQVHKRVWPTAQRDALFWSHMRSVEVTPEEKAAGVIDTWIVCNKSCEHPTAPLGLGGCLRVDLTVCFLCQTVATGDRNNRSNLNCK